MCIAYRIAICGILGGCAPVSIPLPPESDSAISTLYLATHDFGTFAQAVGPLEQVRFELQGVRTIFAGEYPVTLEQLRIPAGHVAVRPGLSFAVDAIENLRHRPLGVPNPSQGLGRVFDLTLEGRQ
ncbi:MAG: hypothetical protein HY791_05135 [Deltaproteobacteria bacterium]|nr:hypothetical protein [Deltaproteobacteria bacterium]